MLWTSKEIRGKLIMQYNKPRPLIIKVDEFLYWQRIFQFGIMIRVLFYTIIFLVPVPYGPSPPISPLHYQTGVDLGEYLENISFYTSYENFLTLIQIFIDFFIDGNYPERRALGPIYPFFLSIMDYKPGNTVPLSFLIFILETSCYAIWCYIAKEKISGIFGLIFALMPHTIWFSFLISSDIFLYTLGTLFFLVIHTQRNIPILIPFLCFLLVLSKPTGIIFCLGALLLHHKFFTGTISFYIYKVFLILIILFSIAFYTPYFLVDQVKIDNSSSLTDISRLNFSFINIFTKFFHIFGIYKSQSNLLIAEFVRAFFGMFFILGFLNILNNEKWISIPIFILVTFLLFFHVPDWRYILPFLPILMINGITILNKLKTLIITNYNRMP